MQQAKLPEPSEKEGLSSGVSIPKIILIDGVAYDSKGNIVVDQYGESHQRSKLSWAVKTIKNDYSKLPSSIRSTINKYAGINAIFGFIDYSIEDAIY